jgi:methyltransferase (TIGR00027 family)
MKGHASLTAEYMALFRALESSRPADSRLFTDPFASRFLHQWRKLFAMAAHLGAGRRIVEQLLDRAAPGARAAGIARTKWIDDEVNAALQNSTQLVLLGAGFDSRAIRLPSAQQAITFELDQPETSSAKQAALRNALGVLPERIRFITIDFNRQSINEVLTQAGFDWSRPACFVWEGVTNYLSAESVDRALRQVAQTPSGTILLFTYIHRAVLDKPEQFFGAEQLMTRLRSYGEPWTFGLYPEELASYLAERKLTLLKDVGVAEVWQTAGRASSGTAGYEFYRLAYAQIQRPS